jgi:dethiobiotin synthetase
LGTINHTLLTVESARRRGVKIVGMILNDVDKAGTVAGRRNATALRRLTRLPVFVSVKTLVNALRKQMR